MNKIIFSTDVALFSIIEEKLKVLMVKRSIDEREGGKWSLPGGRVDSSNKETSLVKAEKVLKHRLGVEKQFFLKQNKVYDSIGRDPDDYAVSVCYFALIHDSELVATEGDGVDEYSWIDINNLPKDKDIAFDHKEMILDCVESIRADIRDNVTLFKFLPKEFTISEIRVTLENILDVELNPSNFRTKMLSLKILNYTNKKKKENGDSPFKGQPPKLYEIDQERLKSLRLKKGLFL